MRTRIVVLAALAMTSLATAKAPEVAPPSDAEIPALAKALADGLADKTLTAPDGAPIRVGTILDPARAEACLRTISQMEGWPSAWLVVQDKTKPFDLVLRVVREPAGTLAPPDPLFLAPRQEWDDAALVGALKSTTGAKPPHERTRNLAVQSFSQKIETEYVYALPKTGKDAKGLLAMLPEGSLLREASAIDLGDGKRHTMAIVLEHPKFVPADCTTSAGRRAGHRDEGGLVLVLAGETAIEDRLDITETVRAASGHASLPRFTCADGDAEPGAIDRLVDAKLEGREPVRLMTFSGRTAQCELTGASVIVGVKKAEGAFKVFASPRRP